MKKNVLGPSQPSTTNAETEIKMNFHSFINYIKIRKYQKID